MNIVWVALVVSVLATIPQLAQLVRTREARDFNLTSIYLAMLANVLIGVDAIRRGHNPMIVLSVWLIVYWAIVLYLKKEHP
jgi:uncharacterized protein with PQ loop repeat